MLSYIILQILAIVSLGDLIAEYCKFNGDPDDKNYRIDRFLHAVLLGYTSLVLPVLFINYLFSSALDYVFYLHFILGMISSLVWTIKLLQYLHKIEFSKSFNSLLSERYFLAVFLLLIGYIFLSLLYPIRGWDALHYYIPNAFYFYTIDDIPTGFNPLSFFPTFKPPVNTIYIMYGYYISRDFTVNLHPFLFLLSTTLLCYRLGNEIIPNFELGKASMLIFLALPVSYLLIYEYAYYQELPLLYFYSFALGKIFLKVTKNELITFNDALLIGLSISMSILSKMSGYSLFIILLMIIPLTGNSKNFQMLFTFLIFAYLIRNVVYETYVYMAIPLSIIGVYTIILQSRSNSSILDLISSKINLTPILILPIIIGLSWLFFMISTPGIQEFLINTYFKVNNKTIQYDWPSSIPSSIFLENGMRVSFWSSTFYLIFGSLFGIGTAFLFLTGLFASDHRTLKIWLTSFWSIWYSYFGVVSGRYLVPIIVPYVLFSTIGWFKISTKLNLSYHLEFIFLALSLLISFIGIFPIIPIRYILSYANLRFYLYHQGFILLGIVMVLSIIGTIKLVKSVKIDKPQRISILFLIILCFSPFSVQLSVYTYTGFDQTETQSILNYYHRDNYQNLIEYFNGLNMPFESKIISYNTPGLEIFVYRSVFDLALLSHYDGNTRDTILYSSTDEILATMSNNNFEYLIELNTSHVDFPNFVSQIKPLPLYQLSSNQTIFSNVYANPEFIVYKLLLL